MICPQRYQDVAALLDRECQTRQAEARLEFGDFLDWDIHGISMENMEIYGNIVDIDSMDVTRIYQLLIRNSPEGQKI